MTTKCGFVTIIGAPNAGKSSLTNHIVGEKVTIVSSKVQTTRGAVKGIFVADNTQLIFCDTPGIFSAERTLEKAIVSHAFEQISSEMEIIFLIDGKYENNSDNEMILNHLRSLKGRIIIVINKIDLLSMNEVAILQEKYQNLEFVKKLLFISVKTGDGISQLKEFLISDAKESPFLYPEDQLTNVSSRFLAQEITREKLFHLLDKELPYNLSVDTESWKENKRGDIRIHQVIYVMREGQKKIVIGEKASIIKKVGILSREELSQVFGVKVNLFLHVKIKPDWTEKPYMYQHMGLKYPNKK